MLNSDVIGVENTFARVTTTFSPQKRVMGVVKIRVYLS